MTNTFTANDFIEKLNNDELRAPLICEGFAKPIENNREAFLFSIGTSCEEWTKIPLELIEKVEFIGEVSCRDHLHPLVRVHFKESPANDSFGSVFASILRGSNVIQRQPSGFKPDQKRFLKKEGDREPSWIEERVADALWDMWIGFALDSDVRKPTGALGRLRACRILKQKCQKRPPYQNISESKQRQACEDLLDCN